MLLLSKHRILKKHLAFKQGRFPDCNWRLKDSTLSFIPEYVREILKDTGNPSVEGLEILKLVRKKGVYRISHPDDSNQSFILKIFLLRHFSHRLSAHKYGLDEAANFITASNRGVRTPELLGFGQYYARSGLIKANVVVTQDLRGYLTVGQLLQKSNESQYGEILSRTIPVFHSLYLSGCNHIDVNSDAIMLSEDNCNNKVYLLDFQHAQFYDKPSIDILMFEAGYFGRTCRELVSYETISVWRDELLARVDVSDPDEYKKAKETFEFHLFCKGRESSRDNLSRKERKKIR